MRLIIQKEHFFCLRNWALYRDLHIEVQVSYAGGAPDTEQTLELHGGASAPDGILMLLQQETEGTGLLCLALDPAWQEPAVTGFRLHLETAGRPVTALHLEYAAADAMTAYHYSRIPWESVPLTQTELVFARQGEQLIASYAGETAEPSGGMHDASETAGIAEDIRADLGILRYYSGSEAARLASALENLLARLPGLDAPAAAEALAQQESSLAELIDRTQAELRQYQASL